ncbi:MAG: PilZ domain-containing protein [Pseudomonadota bacterium]
MGTADASSQARRQFSRIVFESGVVLQTSSGKHACKLVDISLKGALVERVTPWGERAGEPCSLVVQLADDASIRMTGEVAHVEGGRLGLHCRDIDLDSITNLRRLVELNLGDEAALNREISAMLRVDHG